MIARLRLLTMQAPHMRFIAAVATIVALAACTPGPRKNGLAWSCWPDSVCFGDSEACERVSRSLNLGNTCVRTPTAFCRRGCDTPQASGARPSCSPYCAVDRAACELNTHRTGPCVEEPPPDHPELFPEYSEPGWWCWDLHGPGGALSSCAKAKEDCDWELDDTLAKLGRTRTTAGVVSGRVECARPAAPVVCWSRRIDGELAFVCSVTQAFCEATLAKVRDTPDPLPGHRHEIVGGCSAWVTN